LFIRVWCIPAFTSDVRTTAWLSVLDGMYPTVLGNDIDMGVNISVRHGDAGDAVASPTPQDRPLFGQKFSQFGQRIQLHSHVSEVASIFQTEAK